MRPIIRDRPRRKLPAIRTVERDREPELDRRAAAAQRIKAALQPQASDAHGRLVATPEGRRALRGFRERFDRDPHQMEKLLERVTKVTRPGGPAGSFGRGPKVRAEPKGKFRGSTGLPEGRPVAHASGLDELARKRARRAFREAVGR